MEDDRIYSSSQAQDLPEEDDLQLNNASLFREDAPGGDPYADEDYAFYAGDESGTGSALFPEEDEGFEEDEEFEEDTGLEEDIEFEEDAGLEEDIEFEEDAGLEEDIEFEEDAGLEEDTEINGGSGFEDDLEFEGESGFKEGSYFGGQADSEPGSLKDSSGTAISADTHLPEKELSSFADPAAVPGKELENTLARVQSGPATKKGKKGAVTYREKILRHKRRRYRRTVILVVLAMVLLTAGVILWMQRGYRSAELRRVAVLSAEDGAAYANLNGNVVQYGGSGAICISPRGDTLWTVSYEMQQPIVSVSGNVIAIANRNGYYVYTMDTDGLLGTIHTMLPIQNIAAAENGEVAVIMSDSRTTWVRLYTADGKEIAYLVRTMAENGYPIAAAVSPDGETLCLSSLQISNAAVKSNVSFYNFGRAGRKANDHLVDNSDYIDEAVPYVHYLDDSTCVGVSDKRLILFKNGLFRSKGSVNVLFSENLQGVFSNENFTGLLFTDTTGESQYHLDIYNRHGKKNGSIRFSMQFTDIEIAGDKVYIYNEHQVQIYSLGGRCIYDGEFSSAIRVLVPGATLSDLMVVTGTEVDNVRLH